MYLTKEDFQEYLQDNFNVSSPDELTEHEKILAYERIKTENVLAGITADSYTKVIMELIDYLKV